MNLIKPGDKDEIIAAQHSVSEGDILEVKKLTDMVLSLEDEKKIQKEKQINQTNDLCNELFENTQNYNLLKEEGFDIKSFYIDKVSKYNQTTINNIIKLKNAGFKLSVYDFDQISINEQTTIDKIIKLKDNGFDMCIIDLGRYDDLGFGETKKIAEYNQTTIDNIIKLKNAGLYLEKHDFDKIAKFNQTIIDNVIQDNKIKILEQNGITCKGRDIENLSKINIDINVLNTYKDIIDRDRNIIRDLTICNTIGKNSFMKIIKQNNKFGLLDEIININNNWPNLDLQGTNNLNMLYQKLEVYLDSNIKSFKSEYFLEETTPEKKELIDKMFRLGEYENGKELALINSKGEIVKRKVSPFMMEQETGNCYMIAQINAIRNNPMFNKWLYKSIEYIKNDNPLECKWRVKLPISDINGKWYEVALRELFSEREEGIKEMGNYILKNTDIKDFIISLQRKEQQRVTQKKGGEQIIAIDFIQKDGVKKMYISEDIKNHITEQIMSKQGKYYELFKEYMTSDQKRTAVSSSIGYQILEGIISKASRGKGKVDKKIMEGGVSAQVAELILGESFDYYDISIQGEEKTSKYNMIYINKALENFNTGKFIITCSIKKTNSKEPDKLYSPYFEYNDYDLAEGHAYSIVGYDQINKIMKVVNPWDNNKILDISYDVFFNIFNKLSIAEKKS